MVMEVVEVAWPMLLGYLANVSRQSSLGLPYLPRETCRAKAREEVNWKGVTRLIVWSPTGRWAVRERVWSRVTLRVSVTRTLYVCFRNPRSVTGDAAAVGQSGIVVVCAWARRVLLAHTFSATARAELVNV